MTEDRWLGCPDPMSMLTFLRDRVSERKLRLFAAASFRRLERFLPDPRQRRGLEVLEDQADGLYPPWGPAVAQVRHSIPARDPGDDEHFLAVMLYREFCSTSIGIHAVQATGPLTSGEEERAQQVRLLRCIVGNPFRPVTLDTDCLSPTVISLALGIYQNRSFDRLPILADALEDAGCDHADLLRHLRGDGPHVRGCWPLDLVLGFS